MITYKGDIRLVADEDGDLGINIQSGQPEMTEFIDTAVNLYVFGEDSWYNASVKTEDEKMKSRFPGLLRNAGVSDDTIAKGIAYLKEALQPLLNQNVARSISVEGEIISVYGIAWTINIERVDSRESKYSVLWEKGFIQLFGVNN